MFALAALVTFLVAFILNLLSVSTGVLNLTLLGLVFFAAHFVFNLPWRRVP